MINMKVEVRKSGGNGFFKLGVKPLMKFDDDSGF
jgi:hypothetical protein